MPTYICPLVGMHFRPPAKALVSIAPMNAGLVLKREPDNPYDPNAIQVHLCTSSIPESTHAELEQQAMPMGFSLEDLLGQSLWHIGYVASKPPKGVDLSGKTLAPTLAPLLDIEPQKEWPARLRFDAEGLPLVYVDLGE